MILRLLTLLLLCATALPAARRDQMRNRLYTEEARLKVRLDSLEHLPALPATDIAPHPVYTLPRSWKARQANHPDTPKVKLKKRSRIQLLGPANGNWRLVYNGDTLELPPHRRFADELEQTWQAWLDDSLDTALRAERALRLRALQKDLIRQELAQVPGLVKLYKKQGPHQEIEPMLFLRSRALPDWEEEGQRLYYNLPASVPLAIEPWAPAADFPGAVLYYSGGLRDCLAFRDPASGRTWFLAPTEVRRSLPEAESAELLQLESLLAERRRAARTYDLLQRWDRRTVDRVMQGLAWQGMSRAMLLEALGEPAERMKDTDGEWWEYAAGNRVRLEGDKVREILQEPAP